LTAAAGNPPIFVADKVTIRGGSRLSRDKMKRPNRSRFGLVEENFLIDELFEKDYKLNSIFLIFLTWLFSPLSNI